MAHAQKGIVEETKQHSLFLIFKVTNPKKNARGVASECAAVPSLVESVGQLDPSASLSGTVSFGSGFWDAVSPGRRPRQLHPFKPITSGGRKAPSTGGDLLFHINSKRVDLNFELGRRITMALGKSVKVVDEVEGFSYLDSRDLTGFIDGTANPKGDERAAVALIGDKDAEWRGSSYVLTQRYVHNLDKWATLSNKEQEQVIGRTKADSTELSEEEKPPTAHISRVEIEEEGEELKIVRHSMPYGKAAGEAGLFFIAYAKDARIFEKMLNRMFVPTKEGVYDHLMDYTRPVSGAIFFAPSLDQLKRLA